MPRHLPCGHLSENEKDYDSPIFARIYACLAMADRSEVGDDFPNWLNANGFANMTCCPECHVDDFTHVEGCSIAKGLDAAAKEIEKFYTAHPYTPPNPPRSPNSQPATKRAAKPVNKVV